VYKHRICQKLHELYVEYKDRLGEGVSMYSILWRSVAPSIPELLTTIDEDAELREKIVDFIKQLLKVIEDEEASEDQ